MGLLHDCLCLYLSDDLSLTHLPSKLSDHQLLHLTACGFALLLAAILMHDTAFD